MILQQFFYKLSVFLKQLFVTYLRWVEELLDLDFGVARGPAPGATDFLLSIIDNLELGFAIDPGLGTLFFKAEGLTFFSVAADEPVKIWAYLTSDLTLKFVWNTNIYSK